jgi:DNA-cytosine methyltransferase
MSCAQIASNRAGLKIDNYYASEIDKYATQITLKNYPNTIQLGDITKWEKWNIKKPDLIIGGSPCQGFSIAGKHLNFKDERSKLFFTFVDILKYYKPKYFLLENVSRMDNNVKDKISELLNVEPMKINSALVSAQNRERLYWFNWNCEQPKDKGILLKDIIDVAFDGETYLMRNKSKTIRVGGRSSPMGSKQEWDNIYLKRNKYGLCIQIGEANLNTYRERKAVYSIEGKCPTLLIPTGGYSQKKISKDNLTWRKLTPLECERLQTVPDNYTSGVSNTQRYKMLGNGFTVDVITHILKEIN